jgi:hypothetical protein
LVSLAWAAHVSQPQSADAQQATTIITMDPTLHTVVDAAGMPPTVPNAPLFRAGTNPLVPLTRSNGDPITLADFTNVTGQIDIAARTGGGTDVSVDVQGLFPGELYSVWAGYWADPGFPFGPRIAFGAVSQMGDGSDNFMVADANGTISLNLAQREGPMTVHGSAPSYSALSPALNSNGDPVPHTGSTVGIAYHFNNPPSPPFLNPGPPSTWALQGVGAFAAVPEPSSIALATVMVVGCGVVVLRRRTT